MSREILDLSSAYEYLADKVADYISKLKYVDVLIEMYRNNEEAYYIEAVLKNEFGVEISPNTFVDIYNQASDEMLMKGSEEDMKKRMIQLLEELVSKYREGGK